MAKYPTTRQKEHRTMLGRNLNPGRLGKRPVKLARSDRKQRIRDSAPRHGGH
jgi:hypothetical protein